MKTRPRPEPKTPLPGIRARRRRDTRERLYRAALDEFRSAGFANAQIDPIARAAGVARGTFYFHFPTKEHVLLELQRRLSARAAARLPRRRPKSLRAFLLQVVDAVLAEEAALGDPDLMRELLAMYVRRPVVLDLAAEPLLLDLLQAFRAAAGSQQMRADVEPRDVILLFGLHLFGMMMPPEKPVPRRARRAECERAIDIIVRGIAP